MKRQNIKNVDYYDRHNNETHTPEEAILEYVTVNERPAYMFVDREKYGNEHIFLSDIIDYENA